MDKRASIAFHQAGHALACYRTRTHICFVSLEPDEDCLDLVLLSKVWGARTKIIEEPRRGRTRARQWAERIAFIALAGSAAEERFAGRAVEGTDEERRAQRFLGGVCTTDDELAAHIARIHAEATKAMSDEWPLVEALAWRLTELGCVSGRLARRVLRKEEERLTRPPQQLGPPITEDDLRGLPGLRQVAIETLLAKQPRTVKEALATRDIGRKTIRSLLEAGLVTDPEGLQRGSRPRHTDSARRDHRHWHRP